MKTETALQQVRQEKLPGRPRARLMLPSPPKPQPLEEPAVDPELPDLPALERSAEVLRYQTLRAEYSLSPGGRLRAWVKLMLILFVVFGLPAALFTPVLVLLASGLADVSAELSYAAGSLMKAGVSVAVVAGLLVVALLIFRR